MSPKFAPKLKLKLWRHIVFELNLNCVLYISRILFEVGIQYLVCGYTSVAYCFWVTVTLTSGLSFVKNGTRSTFPIFFKVGIPKHFGVAERRVLFPGYWDLTSGHGSRKIVYRTYLLY